MKPPRARTPAPPEPARPPAPGPAPSAPLGGAALALPAPIEPLLDIRQVARVLHASVSTTARLVKDGFFTPLRLAPRVVRFDPGEVRLALERLKAQPEK